MPITNYDLEFLEPLVPEALALVSNKLIWKYSAETNRIIEAYQINVMFGCSDYEKLGSWRYKSYSCVSNMLNH